MCQSTQASSGVMVVGSDHSSGLKGSSVVSSARKE